MALTNETHGIGKFFWHSISLKRKTPICHRFPTHEIDAPYRWSNSLILRLPGTTYGLVLGWWHSATRTEEEAILAGMAGRDMTYGELREEQKPEIRRNMIRQQLTAEQQEILVEALDL